MSQALPLAGLKVVEFTHMVMGPNCGMVLADLGAECLKIEPIGGEHTRESVGAATGFFTLFNRNKKSISLDVKSPEGNALARKLCLEADVVVENFKPGAMKKLGLDYASLSAENPKLIYVSCKGFLPGPYEHRTALDEVVQMMGGLAYMTGRPGDPLRAGSSVNDIMGGMFGAIGALGALIQRGITGKGQEVQSALYENNVFLVGQHMLQALLSGKPAAPMPNRISPWSVYDVFSDKNGEQIFLAAVSDSQWQTFCAVLGFTDLAQDERYMKNNDRVSERPKGLLQTLRDRIAQFDSAELTRRFEKAGLPYAPILKPEQLWDDEHLNGTGALAPITVPSGIAKGKPAKTILFPFTLDGERLGVRRSPPMLGEHTTETLTHLGLSAADIAALKAKNIVQ